MYVRTYAYNGDSAAIGYLARASAEKVILSPSSEIIEETKLERLSGTKNTEEEVTMRLNELRGKRG